MSLAILAPTVPNPEFRSSLQAIAPEIHRVGSDMIPLLAKHVCKVIIQGAAIKQHQRLIRIQRDANGLGIEGLCLLPTVHAPARFAQEGPALGRKL